jgi:hypothetical protein
MTILSSLPGNSILTPVRSSFVLPPPTAISTLLQSHRVLALDYSLAAHSLGFSLLVLVHVTYKHTTPG